MADVKILDLSRIFTGPFCAQVLGDLGADVIKVEPPGGDDTRKWGPPYITEDMSSYFSSLNRNKRSIELNLKEDHDYEILTKLIKWADVIIENYRTGVARNLNIDYDTVRKINDNMVYLSISGFGGSGPYRDHPSYDIIAQSESGIMGITGTEEGEVTKPGIPLADISAGLYGAIGILSALRVTDREDRSVHIQTDLFGSLTSWLTYQSMNAHFSSSNPKPLGTAHPNIVPYQSFKCSDGEWLSIAIGNHKLWERFKQVLQHPELDNSRFATNKLRVEHRQELIQILKTTFRTKTAQDWYNIMDNASIPVGKINTIDEVHDHPQIEHTRQLHFVSKNSTNIPVIVTPIRFVDHSTIDITAPPSRDEDRKSILEEIEDITI